MSDFEKPSIHKGGFSIPRLGPKPGPPVSGRGGRKKKVCFIPGVPIRKLVLPDSAFFLLLWEGGGGGGGHKIENSNFFGGGGGGLEKSCFLFSKVVFGYHGGKLSQRGKTAHPRGGSGALGQF